MAKNYTLKEATEIILKGESTEEIIDITRRFPLLALKLTSILTKAPNDFMDLVQYFPEYLTATKVYKAMKNDEEKEEEPKTPQEVREEKAKVKEEEVVEEEEAEDETNEVEETIYDNKGRKELFLLCKKRGLKVNQNMKKEKYIELLVEQDSEKEEKKTKKATKQKVKEVEETTEDDDWDDEPTPVKEEPKKEVVKKEKKQPKKKEAIEEDEDDDWDI